MEKKNKKKKESSSWIAVIAIGVAIVKALDSAIELEDLQKAVSLIVIIALAVIFAAKDKKKRKANADCVQCDEGSTSLNRTVTAEKPGVYDETLRERRISHELEHQLKQLDSFLENGLIDKEEYEYLKNRKTRTIQ